MPHSAKRTRALGFGLFAVTAAVIGLVAPAAAIAGQARPARVLCEGQSFSQQFQAFGDNRFYTLLPGAEFNDGEPVGWTLSGGAEVLEGTRPDGSTGGVLNLPVGARAVSPPMCVTLAYPTARAWVDGSGGGKGIGVSVSYAGTDSEIAPEEVGKIVGRGAWALGRFNVAPTLAGSEEAPREVRFIFEGRKGTNQLFDIFIDPRMSR